MSDLTRKLAETKQAIEARAPTEALRMFFEPRPCADSDAFERQCAAEAGRQPYRIIRFVRPGDVAPAGALH